MKFPRCSRILESEMPLLAEHFGILIFKSTSLGPQRNLDQRTPSSTKHYPTCEVHHLV